MGSNSLLVCFPRWGLKGESRISPLGFSEHLALPVRANQLISSGRICIVYLLNCRGTALPCPSLEKGTPAACPLHSIVRAPASFFLSCASGSTFFSRRNSVL